MKIDKTTLPYRGFLTEGVKVNRMSELETRVMVKLLLGGEPMTWDNARDFIDGKGEYAGQPAHFYGQIMMKRLEAHFNVEDILTPETFFMVICLDHFETPAIAVMWAYTLGLLAAEEEKPIDMHLLCRVFPWGFPTKEAMNEQWDGQKGYMQEPQIALDNMLDTPLWWERINKVITDRKALPLSE